MIVVCLGDRSATDADDAARSTASPAPAAVGHPGLMALLACLGYIVVFAGIGIRWFQWDAR